MTSAICRKISRDHPMNKWHTRDNARRISSRGRFKNCLHRQRDVTLIFKPQRGNRDRLARISRNQESRYVISRVRESGNLVISVMRYRIGRLARYALGDVQKAVCMRARAEACVMLCDVRKAWRHKSGEMRN